MFHFVGSICNQVQTLYLRSSEGATRRQVLRHRGDAKKPKDRQVTWNCEPGVPQTDLAILALTANNNIEQHGPEKTPVWAKALGVTR
jgi:hypothetical protein